MALIEYDNKVALNENPSIADINKVKADDMNEIKSVVNTNYGELSQMITNTQSSSTTNTYSCKYSNEHFGGVILYNNTTGVSTGTVPLSDSIQNYSFIEVYGYATTDQVVDCCKMPQDRYDKRGNLYSINSDGNIYIKLLIFEFTNNTTINIRKNISWWKPNNTASGGYNANENEIKIVKVIGYK